MTNFISTLNNCLFSSIPKKTPTQKASLRIYFSNSLKRRNSIYQFKKRSYLRPSNSEDKILAITQQIYFRLSKI